MKVSGLRGLVPFLLLLAAGAGAAALFLPRAAPPAPSPPLNRKEHEPRRSRRPPPPLPPPPPPASLAGRVLPAPESGAWVRLTGAGRELTSPLRDGAFSFPEVPSGVTLTLWLGPDRNGSGVAKLAERLVLSPGERRTLDVTAPGRAALRGLVLDAAGKPLAGVRVAVLDPAADFRAEVPVAAVTGADGAFYVGFAASATAGPLRLVVDAVAKGFVLEERIVEPDPQGGGVLAVEVRLAPGLDIAGAVLGPGDVPVADAEVHVLEDYRGDPAERRPVEGRVRTGRDGRFRDGAYRPGVYRISVAGEFSGKRIAAVKDAVAAGDEAVVVRIRGFGRMRVEFADAATREPVALDGGTVEFVYGHTGEEEEYAEWLDLSGKSAAECEDLPEGHYRVTAWAGDREEVFSDLIFVEAGKDLGLLRFGMEPLDR